MIFRGGAKIGQQPVIYGWPIIDLCKGSEIRIGSRAVLTSISAFNAIGVNRKVTIRTLSANSKVTIGDDVGISGAIICASTSIHIGAGTLVGANVIIADNDFHPVDDISRRYSRQPSGRPVHIGENVFLGTNTIVLKGSTIGENSVIGAGSVVSGLIPPNVVAAGNPCRIIRELNVGRLV
ncbi:acyltransferase [Halopseudomonas nanhaiensis]|nr:acyltransferase [Halopseudomonas nanhaiensis]UAX00006.1 acyltransferase [Halopseudomonas nanhaiensis]